MRSKGTAMTFKIALATALMLTAATASVAPAVAGEDDDAPSTRVQRNWNGGGNTNSGQRATVNRGTSSGHTTQAAVPSRPAAASGDDDDSDSVRAATRGNHGGSRGGNPGGRYDRQFELDPAEAARIRQAHRETEGRVTLRRHDGDYDDVPSYYTPPRRHWYSWW
jgi:hypothetical protein